jgi:hypothetical protein
VSAPGPAAHQAGRESAPPAGRFGPNSAEVAAFIDELGRLTPAQWRKVVAARRLATMVVRDGSGQPADEIRTLLIASRNRESPLHEPMASVAVALAVVLEGRADEEVQAACQAASALVRRRQLAALSFAAHYMPFATVIPPASPDPPATVRGFIKALRWLGPAQWEALARPWALDRESLGSLLQAAVKSAARDAEEAAGLAALAVVPKHLPGDSGWAAVKTAVHGSRVLACRAEFTSEQLVTLWAPLEEAIALRSLDERNDTARPAPARAKRAKTARAEPKRAAASRGALYGPNTTEVAAFAKAMPELTAIQWLRVLDRRQLVASVMREAPGEPAAVVRSIFAAVRATREMELDARCRIFSAVERAGFAIESRDRASAEQSLEHYGAFAAILPFSEVDAGTFAARVKALNPEEWTRLADSAPPAGVEVVSPLVNTASALADHLAERTDDEVVGAWQAAAALVRRHLLSPIKFAASYAPFASAIPVTKTRALTPPAKRYVTAVGRLSANQCSILAEPWLLPDDVSNALSKAVNDGAARPAEEAAALVGLVTVPMRLTGSPGWAAAKTVAFGGRVIATRGKVSDEEFIALWKPIERAIPIASLDAPAKRKA